MEQPRKEDSIERSFNDLFGEVRHMLSLFKQGVYREKNNGKIEWLSERFDEICHSMLLMNPEKYKDMVVPYIDRTEQAKTDLQYVKGKYDLREAVFASPDPLYTRYFELSMVDLFDVDDAALNQSGDYFEYVYPTVLGLSVLATLPMGGSAGQGMGRAFPEVTSIEVVVTRELLEERNPMESSDVDFVCHFEKLDTFYFNSPLKAKYVKHEPWTLNLSALSERKLKKLNLVGCSTRLRHIGEQEDLQSLTLLNCSVEDWYLISDFKSLRTVLIGGLYEHVELSAFMNLPNLEKITIDRDILDGWLEVYSPIAMHCIFKPQSELSRLWNEEDKDMVAIFDLLFADFFDKFMPAITASVIGGTEFEHLDTTIRAIFQNLVLAPVSVESIYPDNKRACWAVCEALHNMDFVKYSAEDDKIILSKSHPLFDYIVDKHYAQRFHINKHRVRVEHLDLEVDKDD